LSDPPPIRVALTFDAEHPDRSWCPPGAIETILDALASAAVRATFFVQGRWALSQPMLARRIAEEGHLIGHHSHYHARMPLLHDDGIRQDLREGTDAILATTGADPRPWFRTPFGAGHDDDRIRAVLEDEGYRDVGWHVEVDDWEAHRDGPAIASDALAGVRDHGDGAVVLLHTWPGGTARAVAPLLAGFTDLGARSVTVDQLERLP
jgi:peptidoglycan/xylan/chitin deacetylase (PgdA/CDA1 family)